jgi:hypothetical protein
MSISILCNWTVVKAEKKWDRRAYDKARYLNPERNAYLKAYKRTLTPEQKSRKREADKARRQNPEYKNRMKALRQNPEFKYRENTYKLAYLKSDNGKAKTAATRRIYYAINLEKFLNHGASYRAKKRAEKNFFQINAAVSALKNAAN